ncbi:hypothetical protein Pan97_00970 [Bremerella volcania]|uniref:Uncharacterized protein n=1 Tax=Bremerella volcania TaxID=2527984 RepID=A0A518C1M4_9BACT|nr:hypothetical protein [Bremerella volcania]QDU73130.1 hypothetical protein Pan97_00970 [Bremerella volcania]
MKMKEEQLRESPVEVRVIPITLGSMLFYHVILASFAIGYYPFWLWSQFAMVGFWLALGEGKIWLRLLLVVVGLYIVAGCIIPMPVVDGGYFSAIFATIGFTTLFAGLGVIALGQNPKWTFLRVQFRFWELIIGTASLGVAFFVLREVGDFDAIQSWRWKFIYYILLHASLLGLGTAAVGMSLMAQPGLPRQVVRCVAALLTVVIPFVDYVACESLRIRLFDFSDRLYFYWTNLAIVWITVLIYQDAINSGERMIFEVNCDEQETQEPPHAP